MASAVAERIELAKHCTSKDWSKAIRVLDSFLSRSCIIQDLCNRAFCYSQLELHKHVIKDCDRALELDLTHIEAYILKGHAFSALGRKEEALSVWKKGYEHAVCKPSDLKQLLELEELLGSAKGDGSIAHENHAVESTKSSSSASEPVDSVEPSETYNHLENSNGKIEHCSKLTDRLDAHDNLYDGSEFHSESSRNDEGIKLFGHQSNGKHESQPNGANYIHEALSDSSQSCMSSSALSSESINLSDIYSESINLSETCDETSDEAKSSKKFCVARISKNKSINVDFRLSRGIAQVNDGKYSYAVEIFDKILEEDPDYPEALIGRGTAYAFQRELHSAIADFTKAIQSNPSAGEAWKRRGQARAALGESVEFNIIFLKEIFDHDDKTSAGIVNYKFKDFTAAVEDLSACVKVDKDNKSAYTYLGLALSSIGEYRRAEEAHMKAIQIDRNFMEAWGHLTQAA
ncbi:suppressor of RPS4-RLD 1 [Olea europaea subsp. europaea]|uniref:Suppressor of RPS4-RLD 1 n=1 Tax=Olea europaea subsp. europaea TaxID=158383 RepID=A0A8S0U5Y2_OLEEU|nr:suppressor of RPS4-RLD 1 [Olea europaea subsp. europaea]